jgi:hypothetical protein
LDVEELGLEAGQTRLCQATRNEWGFATTSAFVELFLF